MQTFGVKGKIVLPEIAKKHKIEAIKKFGAQIELFGDDCVKAEEKAKQYAQENDSVTYISPYCDIDVVYGQGTIG